MIRTCAACGQKNRIPASRLAQSAKCGACKKDLGSVAEPIELGTADFESVIQGSELPVVVDFWAPWCGPCRMAAPTVEQIAKDFSGRVLVAKVNTQEHPALAQKYGVRGIPNFAVFKSGQMKTQQAGLMPLEHMRSWVQQHI